MKGQIKVLAALMLGLIGATAPPNTDQLLLRPESKLWVEGGSTIRSWKCDAAEVNVNVSVTAAGNAVKGVLAGDKAVTAVQLDVPTAKLDCHNDTMNEHMLKALKAGQNPVIVFQLTGYELASIADAKRGTLNGSLKIGGTERPVSFPVDLRDGGDGALRVAGNYELNMRDYGLKPPSLMLGTIKVGEKVMVSFDLFLK